MEGRSLVDGCGLNSPGCWKPSQRGLGLDSDELTIVEKLASWSQGTWRAPRFQIKLGDSIRAAVLVSGQPFFLSVLAQTAKVMGEEEWEVLLAGEDSYSVG